MSKPILFNYAEKYPTGPIIKFDDDDVAYLQEHIRTYRAINTGGIDGQQGKYYEAAVTLLDVFSYMPIAFAPTECNITIIPNEITTVEFTGVIFGLESVFVVDATPIQAVITLQYTNRRCFIDIPGYYTVTITRTDTGESVTVGDADMQKVTPDAEPGMLCFVANSNALRYCECFPSPCILRTMILEAHTKLIKETDSNETDQ